MSQTVLEAPGADVPDEGDEDAVKDVEGITELESFEPDSVHGVLSPASGVPTLVLKSIKDDEGDGEAAKADNDADDDADGDDDDDDADDSESGEDTAKAVADATPEQREAYQAAAAEWRAREPVPGDAGTGTTWLQKRAAWHRWEAEGVEKGLDGSEEGARRFLAAYAPSDEAIKATAEAESAALGDVEKTDYSAEERRQLAREGKALSDGSYPIKNTTDLDNAYRLAASGHGNVAAAKRLIAKRARELGVPNPFDKAKGKAKKAKKDKSGWPDCKTCHGSGKIKDGHVTCPDCKGKGKVKPGKTEKGKFATGGVISGDTITVHVGAGERLVDAQGNTYTPAEWAHKAKRPLPADVKPAGHHREPDGTSTVERLEPEAGLKTDPDKVKDKVPASVGKEAPSYAVQRMHDATCAAYSARDVLDAYPALSGIGDALEAGWLTKAATEAVERGKAKKGARLAALAEAATLLKGADPDLLADAHGLVHKAFTDMYPTEHCSPTSPPSPGSYQRPYLSAGHAAEHATGKVNVPPSSHVPDPGQFHRGYLSAGHAADSPANSSTAHPSGGRPMYAAASKTYAEQSLKALHDHIEATYGGVCPMAPSRSVLPPDMGARNVPQARAPQAPSGVDGMNGQARKEGKPVNEAKKAAKAARKERQALAAEVAKALAAQGSVADADAIAAVVESRLAPVREQYEQKISELTKQVDELGAQPDPAMAPVRGQMARSPQGTAAPVEKRSLVDEAREREQAALAKEAGERVAYIEYLRKQAASTSPQVREAAQAELDKIGETAALAAAPA